MNQRLEKLETHEFITYDTEYNEPFVNALPKAVLNKYDIHYIKNLHEATDGYIVIPPTNAKGPSFQGSTVGYEIGNELDPVLSSLIKSKEILRCAVGCYQTINSSRYWSQNAEIAAYREFFLHEVDDEDRWKGMGWILDVQKLKTTMNGTEEA